MPYRKRQIVKRKRKANTWRGKYNPRPLQLLKKRPSNQAPRIINFKRTYVDTIILNTAVAPAGWTTLSAGGDHALVANYNVSLSQIANYTNFTNLFDSYKISGVRLQAYIDYTSTDTVSHAQTILYSCRDHLGQNLPATLTEDWFLERPRSQKTLCINAVGKPAFDIFMPVSQLGLLYNSAVNTDYSLTKPKFISTNEPGTPHYGFNLRLQRVDNNNWTHGTANSYPTMKIYTTIYFALRGINS